MGDINFNLNFFFFFIFQNDYLEIIKFLTMLVLDIQSESAISICIIVKQKTMHSIIFNCNITHSFKMTSCLDSSKKEFLRIPIDPSEKCSQMGWTTPSFQHFSQFFFCFFFFSINSLGLQICHDCFLTFILVK